MGSCELCDASREDYRIIKRHKEAFSVICKSPLNEGHVLVIPNRHVTSIYDLSQSESHSLLYLVEFAKSLISKKFPAPPIVFQNSGSHSTQEHIHIHVLPSSGNLRQLVSRYENIPERPEISEEEMEKCAQELRDLLGKI